MMETVDATLAMLAKQPVQPQDVERVVVRIPASGARTVNNRKMPDVNVQYMVSTILLDGKLTFESAHDYNRFQDPRVQEMKQRVELILDEELERTGARFQGVVEVYLKERPDPPRACRQLPRPPGKSHGPRRSGKESRLVAGARHSAKGKWIRSLQPVAGWNPSAVCAIWRGC